MNTARKRHRHTGTLYINHYYYYHLSIFTFDLFQMLFAFWQNIANKKIKIQLDTVYCRFFPCKSLLGFTLMTSKAQKICSPFKGKCPEIKHFYLNWPSAAFVKTSSPIIINTHMLFFRAMFWFYSFNFQQPRIRNEKQLKKIVFWANLDFMKHNLPCMDAFILIMKKECHGICVKRLYIMSMNTWDSLIG